LGDGEWGTNGSEGERAEDGTAPTAARKYGHGAAFSFIKRSRTVVQVLLTVWLIDH
jgi:hypothetical protein